MWMIVCVLALLSQPTFAQSSSEVVEVTTTGGKTIRVSSHAIEMAFQEALTQNSVHAQSITSNGDNSVILNFPWFALGRDAAPYRVDYFVADGVCWRFGYQEAYIPQSYSWLDLKNQERTLWSDQSVGGVTQVGVSRKGYLSYVSYPISASDPEYRNTITKVGCKKPRPDFSAKTSILVVSTDGESADVALDEIRYGYQELLSQRYSELEFLDVNEDGSIRLLDPRYVIDGKRHWYTGSAGFGHLDGVCRHSGFGQAISFLTGERHCGSGNCQVAVMNEDGSLIKLLDGQQTGTSTHAVTTVICLRN